MKNWRTTFFGILLAFGLGTAQPGMNLSPMVKSIGQIATVAGAALLGIKAQDSTPQQ